MQSDVARVRTPLVVLTTFLVELVVIAAAGNQFVVDRLSKHLNGSILKRGLLESLFTFYWRFSPQHGTDVGHFWLSRVLCVVAVLVLGPLLVALVVRGPMTFVRVFFSVLFAVVVATLLATFVRGLVADPRLDGYNDARLGAAMFRPFGPDAPAFWGGLALGLLVALIVAVVAVATRRAPRVADSAADVAGEAGREHDGDPVGYRDRQSMREGAGREGPPPWQDGHFGPPPPTGTPRAPVAPDGPTQQWRPEQGWPEQNAPTQTLRVADVEQQQPMPMQQQPMQQQPGTDQPTSRFPRPPDEEDMHDFDHER